MPNTISVPINTLQSINIDLNDVYGCYRHWVDVDGEPEEDTWFAIDKCELNFVLGYLGKDIDLFPLGYDINDPDDWGVWAYPWFEDGSDKFVHTPVDITDEFKAYLNGVK